MGKISGNDLAPRPKADTRQPSSQADAWSSLREPIELILAELGAQGRCVLHDHHLPVSMAYSHEYMAGVDGDRGEPLDPRGDELSRIRHREQVPSPRAD